MFFLLPSTCINGGLAEETVAPDGLHHPGTERGEILIELRRPLRHPIQLLLLQKHLLVPFGIIIFIEVAGIIAQIISRKAETRIDVAKPVVTHHLMGKGGEGALMLDQVEMLQHAPYAEPVVFPGNQIHHLGDGFLQFLQIHRTAIHRKIEHLIMEVLLEFLRKFYGTDMLRDELVFRHSIHEHHEFIIREIHFYQRSTQLAHVICTIEKQQEQILGHQMLQLPSCLEPLVHVERFSIVVILQIGEIQFQLFAAFLFRDVFLHSPFR